MITSSLDTSRDKRIYLDRCIKYNSYIKTLEDKLNFINSKISSENAILLEDKELLEYRLLILKNNIKPYRDVAKELVDSLYIFPRFKKILQLTVIEGNSLKDTADIIGLSLRQVQRDYNVFITYFEIPKEECMGLDRVIADSDDLKAKKDFLYRYKRGKTYIDRLEDRLDLLTAKIESVSSPKYSDVKVEGGVPKTIDERIADKIELESRIDRLKKENNSVKYEIYEAIDSLLDNKLAECLELLVIKCMSSEDSADYMYLSHRQFMRVYKKALDNIKIPSEKIIA